MSTKIVLLVLSNALSVGYILFQGSISGQDFASVLIDAAPLDDLDELLDKVHASEYYV